MGIPAILGQLGSILPIALAHRLKDDMELHRVENEYVRLRMVHQVPCKREGGGTPFHENRITLAYHRGKVNPSFLVHQSIEMLFLLKAVFSGERTSDQGLLGEVQAYDPGSRQLGWSVHTGNLLGCIDGPLGSFMKGSEQMPFIFIIGIFPGKLPSREVPK